MEVSLKDCMKSSNAIADLSIFCQLSDLFFLNHHFLFLNVMKHLTGNFEKQNKTNVD